MIVREIQSKSILTPSRLTKYCVNPYTGCEHGCVYCYARFMCRYGGHASEKWGSFVDVKANAPQLLGKELQDKERGSVYISSVTDPYQPLEKKHELTRKMLAQLLEYDFPLFVQTKSSLIRRDIGLLSKMNEAEAGVSLVYTDDADRRNFEGGSSVEERLETVRQLSGAGIKTFVFVAPFLPGITDKDIDGLVSRIAGAGASYIFLDGLNLKCGNWSEIRPVLEKHYPHLLPLYNSIFFNSGNDYYTGIKERVARLCKENSLGLTSCY